MEDGVLADRSWSLRRSVIGRIRSWGGVLERTEKKGSFGIGLGVARLAGESGQTGAQKHYGQVRLRRPVKSRDEGAGSFPERRSMSFTARSRPFPVARTFWPASSKRSGRTSSGMSAQVIASCGIGDGRHSLPIVFRIRSLFLTSPLAIFVSHASMRKTKNPSDSA